MTARPFFGTGDGMTLDERMDLWLSDEADSCRVPDDEREEFMEAMRGTMAFAVTRFDYAWSDLIEGSRLARFVRWSDRKLNRRRGAA